MFNAVMLVTVPDSVHLHLFRIVGETNIIFEWFRLYGYQQTNDVSRVTAHRGW